MAIPTLVTIAEELQEQLATITGLVAEKAVPNSIETPTAIPRVWKGPRLTAGGDRICHFLIDVLVRFSENHQSMLDLYPYMDEAGTKSIIAALEADTTMDGNAAFISTDQPGEGWQGPPEKYVLEQGGLVYKATLRGSIWLAA